MNDSDVRFWNKTAPKYAASKISDMAGFERTLTRTRELIPTGARVLELGCGTGTAASRLADAAGQYLATDISSAMIAIAEAKLQQPNDSELSSRLEFRQATADTLAQEGVRFNVILGFNYLHLAGDLPTVLGQIRTLLAPGGLFISKTPCVGDMNRLIQLAIPLMRMVGKAPNVSVFTSQELGQVLAEAGYTVIDNERHGSKKVDIRPFLVVRAD